MRVKTLELFGFKSFPKKTTVHFEPGVTAIVGPNGTGKTNILDAIRWVLGEHNPRDLRAPRLEDVIFNGTDAVAPLSMAEVSLTIENDRGLLPISFAEVTITRRVYRSGESESFINHSPCRLKDIQELFLGTGLGGGTYAIIEQGHIDLVLSSKPEERRVVFEEASGVAKYLKKKQETVRRLEEVEEHLVRIADIIGEVRRQVQALERAANKARQYKSQWEQLKQLELRLAVDEMRVNDAHAREVDAQVRTLTSRREVLDAQKQQQMASMETLNAAITAIQEQLQALQAEVIECASQIEQHHSQQALKVRWIEELTAQRKQLDEDAQLTRARMSQCDEQLGRLEAEQAELSKLREATRRQLEEHAAALTSVETSLHAAQAAVTAIKAQVFEAATVASHQRNQLAQLTSQLGHSDAQVSRTEAQRAQGVFLMEAVQRRRETIAQERDALQSQYDEIHRQMTPMRERLEAVGARRHELALRVQQLRDELANTRANVALFEELWRRYEGFPETVKTLMASGIEGLIGPLVDVIQAQPGYDTIVEAALGPLAEAVVVRDRQALARCQALLRAQQLEGCRFLVLSDCPDTAPVMAQALAQEGITQAVKQFIRAEPQYQPLVEWLLDDSWLIDDIERALRHPSLLQGRLVSARGDRWDRRSWRLTGDRPLAQHRVGRRQRWEEAQRQLAMREQEFTAMDAQAKEAEQQWQVLLGETEAAKGQLAQMAPTLTKLETQCAQLSHEAQRIASEQQSRELELKELAAQREELGTALTHAQELVQCAQAHQETLERALADAQTSRQADEQRQQQLLIGTAQVEATLRAHEERLSTLQARVQELAADRRQAVEQLALKTAQQQEAVQRLQQLQEQLAQHQTGVDQARQRRAHAEARVAQVSETLRQEEGRRHQVLPHLLRVEQEVSSLVQQIQGQMQQRSEWSFRRSRLIERLQELYQLDEAAIQQAETSALTEEQRASMADQIQKLRAKLEGAGSVSLGSVEEYDELKRRLDFLQTQQQDLVKARDDLKASITQINRTARAQFRETFERITQEFKAYYARLFSGGEANLILLDEDDVLESGIEIIARPPGKRLQSISLLSGGERALTAVALLFALFKVRPSPLCILDEIDAPLDEANVDRFTRVLEEFLTLSQFILITHNKKTITKADSLYGVTMEEPGISKILSAKLSQAERTPAVV